MNRHCVYRVSIVSPVRIQRVQCIANAHTACSVHRHCVYTVLIVSPVHILGQCIVLPYFGCCSTLSLTSALGGMGG
jgi:hypothetical protein